MTPYTSLCVHTSTPTPVPPHMPVLGGTGEGWGEQARGGPSLPSTEGGTQPQPQPQPQPWAWRALPPSLPRPRLPQPLPLPGPWGLAKLWFPWGAG